MTYQYQFEKLNLLISNDSTRSKVIISGGQKKTHQTLDACRFKSIYSIDVFLNTSIAQSVLSIYRKFRYSNQTSS